MAMRVSVDVSRSGQHQTKECDPATGTDTWPDRAGEDGTGAHKRTSARNRKGGFQGKHGSPAPTRHS